MEVGGLVLGVAGVAGLFSVCIDVLEKVDVYKDFDITSKQLLVRFETEKSKLREWASAVGIKENTLLDQHHPRLDDKNIYPLVERILYIIKELFAKTDHLSDRIFRGLTKRKDGSQAFRQGPLDMNEPELTLRMSTKSKLRGMFGDDSRFRQNIENLEVLVQNLYTLVSPKQDVSNEDLFGSMTMTTDQNKDMLRALHVVDCNYQNLMTDSQRRNEIEEIRLIADILDVPKFSDTLSSQTKTRLEGTCDWVFLNPVYQQWLASNVSISKARFLWLFGPAGFGKTIICSRLIEVLRQTHGPFVFHFFTSLHVQSGGRPEGIINLWLSEIAGVDQVCRRLVLENLPPRSLIRGLSPVDLWEAFKGTVSGIQNAIFILDGFDEYAHDGGRRDFLINLKSSLVQTSSRVLVTSRGEPDIRAELTPPDITNASPDLFSYEISQDDTFSDLSLYSRNVVEQKLGKKEISFKQELAQQLTSRSDGMFLWVALSGKALRSSMHRIQLKRIVETAPKGLDSAYERNWNQIISQDDYAKARGLRILQWCMFGFRPLTIGELAVALMMQAFDHDVNSELEELQEIIDNDYINEEILGLCASLIDLKNDPVDSLRWPTVQLKHASVREFLSLRMPRSVGGTFEFNSVSDSSHHLELAKVCLRCLCQTGSVSEVVPDTELGQTLSFRKYALSNWFFHSVRANMDDLDFQHMVQTFFLSDSQNLHQWISDFEVPITDGGEAFSPASNPLYYTAILGNIAIFQNLWQICPSSLDKVGGRYGTPLQAACVYGSTSLVDVLLQRGADININAGVCGTALCAAVWNGQFEIVKCLLASGAAIEQKGLWNWSPLFFAAASGRIEVVKFLLEKGAELNDPDEEGNTVLFLAIQHGHIALVKFLLENGADPFHRSKEGCTALMIASMQGYVDIAQLLLNYGGKLDNEDHCGNTSLTHAIISGHVEAVKILLNCGAKPDHADLHGVTPLLCAISQGHIEVVEILLNHGAKVDHQMGGRVTALQLAVICDQIEIVKVLVTANANVNLPGVFGQTPVQCAVLLGHTEIVNFLDLCTDTKAQDATDQTALYRAVTVDHVAIVEALYRIKSTFCS